MLQAIIYESAPYQTVNLQVSHKFSVFYIATVQHHKVNKKKFEMASPVSSWLLGLVRPSYPSGHKSPQSFL